MLTHDTGRASSYTPPPAAHAFTPSHKASATKAYGFRTAALSQRDVVRAATSRRLTTAAMLRETRPAAWSFAESICLRQLNLRAPRRSRSRDPFYSTSVDAACSAVATPCEGIFPVDIVIAHVAFATASNDAFPETWTLRACQYTRRLRVYGTPKYYILLDY